MRINQFVAAGTGLSRRAADAAIAAGRVELNGRTAVLGQTVGLQDSVTLDASPVTPKATHTYLMLHKPAGYVSSRAHQGDDPTLYELLPAQFQDLRIAGRLDRDSSGLILLSDDGAFIQALTHPSQGKLKRYELTLSAPITPAALAKLAAGIPLHDGLSHVTVTQHNGKQVAVTLGEGRNRQLRRTFGALGFGVEVLHRTHIGPFELGDLAAGKWRPIDAPELPA